MDQKEEAPVTHERLLFETMKSIVNLTSCLTALQDSVYEIAAATLREEGERPERFERFRKPFEESVNRMTAHLTYLDKLADHAMQLSKKGAENE